MFATRVIITLVVMTGTGVPVRAQTTDTIIPTSVRRRLAQAIWPRNLFDSLGRPEAGFVRASFEPSFDDLRVSVRSPAVRALPGVRFYVAHAYPHGCDHCAATVRAVAHRDTADVTLLGLHDIDFLLPWVAPPFGHADSVRIREFVIEVLRATTFVHDPRQVVSRSDIPHADSPFLQASDGRSTAWRMPRTYTHVSPGQMYMEFAVYGSGDGLFRVVVQQQHNGRFLTIDVQPIAQWRVF